MNISFILFSLQLLALCYCEDGYAPTKKSCSKKLNYARAANSLSTEETLWLKKRNQVTNKNLIKFLDNCGLDNFDAKSFIENSTKPITIGVAFSGGGYRAMLVGAGQLSALDERTEGATDNGLGGLLQASTYLVGLSGGNWLVGTVALNNFTSISDILDDGEIWDLKHSIFDYGGYNIIKTGEYYDDLSDDLQAKEDAGFENSLTDIWGRALSYQFFPTTDDFGASLTWSSIRDMEVFKDHNMPFPIVVADGRTPGTYIISGNSTVFEFNAFEMGSWDPSVYSFSDVKHIGTTVKDGNPNGTCVSGFDNAGYVIGTSSSLFNQFLLQINTTSISGILKKIITHYLNDFSQNEDDIAVYKWNPFYEVDYATTDTVTKNDTLFLCDGGEDLQNIPIYPLIQPHRKVDVIFAYDNSADTEQSWPNGTAMIATYERQFLKQGNGTIFPYVPDSKTFRNLNLTSRPTFFGCDAKNLTSLTKKAGSPLNFSVYDSPLIVYTANRPFSYWSNTSTFKMSYDEDEKRGMIQNGYEIASRLNSTLDDEWQACVGCAIIRRQQERDGIEQSDQCKSCFERYCWDGKLDENNPGTNFTNEGQTDGNEDTETGDKKKSNALGIEPGLKVLGYALISSLVTLFSSF